MEIADAWDGMGRESKDWFTRNPGCRALPRTLVNIIRAGYNGNITVDQDGIMPLNKNDLRFLHGVGHGHDGGLPRSSGGTGQAPDHE